MPRPHSSRGRAGRGLPSRRHQLRPVRPRHDLGVHRHTVPGRSAAARRRRGSRLCLRLRDGAPAACRPGQQPAPARGHPDRLAHATTREADPVVFAQGGPGASGLDFATVAPALADAFAGRDLILFDQRGAGHSVPFLHCDERDPVALAELTGQTGQADVAGRRGGRLPGVRRPVRRRRVRPVCIRHARERGRRSGRRDRPGLHRLRLLRRLVRHPDRPGPPPGCADRPPQRGPGLGRAGHASTRRPNGR